MYIDVKVVKNIIPINFLKDGIHNREERIQLMMTNIKMKITWTENTGLYRKI